MELDSILASWRKSAGCAFKVNNCPKCFFLGSQVTYISFSQTTALDLNHSQLCEGRRGVHGTASLPQSGHEAGWCERGRCLLHCAPQWATFGVKKNAFMFLWIYKNPFIIITSKTKLWLPLVNRVKLFWRSQRSRLTNRNESIISFSIVSGDLEKGAA